MKIKMKKIAIVALSNPLKDLSSLNKLEALLNTLNIQVVSSKYLTLHGSLLNRDYKDISSELLTFFIDSSIDGIFDVSGGDLCNSILRYLDYETIKLHPTPFFGYSDLTVVLNALYSKANISTYNYQIMNLLRDTTGTQLKDFKETFVDCTKDSLSNINFTFLNGSYLEGVVVGGNIRCFLKLAGTSYLPNTKDKILLLESNSGDAFKILTFLNQYKDLGILDNISGVILGNFTEMENNNIKPSVYDILISLCKSVNLPIVKTFELGHYPNSRCISIGSKIIIDNL